MRTGAHLAADGVNRVETLGERSCVHMIQASAMSRPLTATDLAQADAASERLELDRRRLTMALGGAGLAVLASAAPSGAWAAEKKKGGGASYIQFPPLETAVPRGMRRRGVLTVEGGIDVPDAGLHQRAVQSTPLLRDAYLRWLTIYATAMPPGAPPDPDLIQAELQRTTDRVLGRAGAHYLIGTVMLT